MSIPSFDQNGALPAFVGSDPTTPKFRSPYKTNVFELVARFNTSSARAKLLLGLNSYRKKLFEGGFVSGSQWIDGSFVEDVEGIKGRAPNDVDLLTLFRRPIAYQGQDTKWMNDYRSFIHFDFFDTHRLKPIFHCDCYGLDLHSSPESLISTSSYWFGLFSEQRETFRKKGIVEIPLSTDNMEFLKVETEIRKQFDV